MQAQTLEGGFTQAPVDAAKAFRQIMQVIARPGDILALSGARPPAPLSVAAGTIVLTLCDPETPVFLGAGFDTPDLREWITFHTGAPFVTEDKARFAIGAWRDLTLSLFSIGTPEYPDRSATLIVELPSLTRDGVTLNGPGIKDRASLSLPNVADFQANAALFPLGLDFFFTCGDRIAGLPRTTKVS